MKPNLETRVAILEEQVAHLQAERPGRKRRPILVSTEGVCGLDPERNSATCPDATVYRHQQGCRGTACDTKAKDYYAKYRKNGKKAVGTRRRSKNA